MSNKVVFIIPGYKHSPEKKEYQTIGKFFKAKNIDPVFVDVNWKYLTISQNVEEFLKLFNNTRADYKCVLGFSFGAIIACKAASSVNVNDLILCSLSPYFAEDLPKIKQWWKQGVGKRRVTDFNKLEASKLFPLIKARTFILYGTKEGEFVTIRVKDTYKRLKCKKELVVVEGVKHDIADSNYLKAIEKVIENL